MRKKQASIVVLVALSGIAFYFCLLLIVPFLKPITFSILVAIVFFPLYRRLRHWIPNRSIAAVLTTMVVLLLILLVSFFLGRALIAGLRDTYQSLISPEGGKEKLGLYMMRLLEGIAGWAGVHFPGSASRLQGVVASQAEKLVASLLDASTGFVRGVTSVLVDAALSFFILFFLFRDGRVILRRMRGILPLERAHADRLVSSIRDSLHAILYGTLAIALLQGLLTGIGFAILGIASPALWAVVTSLCALLPVVGTAFVYLPAIAMLAFYGYWIKSLILAVWAVVIVHPVDNVLRPYWIGGRTKLSTLYVFFALLGGVKVFGGLGIFLGPLILALSVALCKILSEEMKAATAQRLPTPIASTRAHLIP